MLRTTPRAAAVALLAAFSVAPVSVTRVSAASSVASPSPSPANATAPAPPLPRLLGPSSGGVHEAVLDNGLRVLIKEVHTAPLFLCSVWYGAGSARETTGQTGLAHLLEHMMFKGTARYDKGEFDRILESNGADNNASTGHDRTEYHILIAAERADLALELEADRMRGALFTQADLEDEMTVVRNEMEKGEDDPWNETYERLQSIAILEHPYHWPVIGWKSDVEAITAEQIHQFYDQYYRPNNAWLVLIGALPAERMLEMAVRHFGTIPRGPELAPLVTVEPPQKGERRFVIREAGRTRILGIGWRVPERLHSDGYVLDLYAGILGQGRTSRLYPVLVESGLATYVTAYNGSDLRDPFLFHVWVELAEDADPAVVEAAIEREVDRLRREAPLEEEVTRARKRREVQELFSRDDLVSLMYGIGEAQSAGGYTFWETYLDSLERVTPSRVREMAQRWMHPDARTIGLYLPYPETSEHSAGHSQISSPAAGDGTVDAGRPSESTGKLAEHSAGAAAGSSAGSAAGSAARPAAGPSAGSAAGSATRPAAGTAASISAALPHRFELSNGPILVVRESRDNPTIELRARIEGGMCLEPPGREGVSSLTARALPLGTTRRSAQEIASALESNGIDFDVAAGPEEITVRARSLTEDFPLLIELLAEILLEPAFAAEQLDVARAQARAALDEALQDTGSLARRRALEALYGTESPYARFPEGSTRSLAAVTPEDVTAYHRELLHGRRWTLAVVGDIGAEDARRLFEERLANLPPGEPVRSARPVLSTVASHDPIRIEVADKSQVDLVYAGPGVRPDDPAYPAVHLANVILGGAFTSRLQGRLRDDEGLTYNAGSFFIDRVTGSAWVAALGVHPENVDQALASMRRELAGLRDRPITVEELEKAREYAAGSFPIRTRTKGRIADALLHAERFALGVDYLSAYPEKLRAVTLEEVRAAAMRFADPERLVVVGAGTF